jgi:hypothetical protein
MKTLIMCIYLVFVCGFGFAADSLTMAIQNLDLTIQQTTEKLKNPELSAFGIQQLTDTLRKLMDTRDRLVGQKGLPTKKDVVHKPKPIEYGTSHKKRVVGQGRRPLHK